MYLSEIISMPVLSAKGKSLGYVKSATFTKKWTISHLVCVNADEEEFYLPMRALRFDVAVHTNASPQCSASGSGSPISKPIYLASGNFLGRASDLEVNTGTLFCKKDGLMICLPIAKLNVSDVIIIPINLKHREGTSSRGKISDPSTATTISGAEELTYVTAEQSPPADTKTHAAQINNADISPAPTSTSKRLTPYNLLGRTLKRDFIMQSETLALAGDKVTAPLIHMAAQNNRLLELSKITLP